ncbi:MAG: LTA synthase family protein [Parasporobacterium sp.]|nr:LTA synthase family protein [Parasporobacterium sp.]
MKQVNARTKQSRRRKKSSPGKYAIFLFLPLLMLYLGLFTRIFASVKFSGFIIAACFDITSGVLLTFVALLFNKTVARYAIGVIASLLSLWHAFNVVIQNSFHVYLPLGNVAAGAGNAAAEFSSSVFSAVIGSLLRILVLFLPAVLYWAFAKKIFVFPYLKKIHRGKLLDICLLVFAFCVVLCNVTSLKASYRTNYTYDSAVKHFGVFTATRLDVQYKLFGSPARKTLEKEEEVPAEEEGAKAAADMDAADAAAEVQMTAAADETEAALSGQTEKKTETGLNVMDIDFDAVADTGNPNIDRITEYVSDLNGTNKNQYTGLFEGKNLILVCAEAFDTGIIDPVMTPTLYRMKYNGINFTDFYQPFWGGSTSTGEVSFLLGLAPLDGMETVVETEHHNNYFTPGNQLQRLNYYNAAFHNGDCNYYERMYTHPNLGYQDWIADGDGLEELIGNSFIYSDITLFESTLPLYLEKTPFSVYYMSFSGHAPYVGDDYYAVYNLDLVEEAVGDSYSDKLKYYFAHNVELDQAMEYVIDTLEEAGIADDTVIVICPDHFPYGLLESEAWENEIDYLPELLGHDHYQDWEQDESELLIWCGSLEHEDRDMACTITAPVFSLDIVPTLSNLFGFEYDSRLLAGRDVFSDAEAIVFWQNGSWVTEKGKYSCADDMYYPNDPEDDDRVYFHRIDRIVQNRLNLSDLIIKNDYYAWLFGSDTDYGRQIYPQTFYIYR